MVVSNNKVTAAVEEIDLPNLGNLYTGNIMYVKPDVKNNPDKVYVQIMIRFCNFDEVEEVPVQLFTNKETFNAGVGDLVTFKARRLVNAIDAHGNPIILPDGTGLLKASGLINGGELTVIKASAPTVRLNAVGEMQSAGLKKKLAELSPALGRFLGIN